MQDTLVQKIKDLGYVVDTIPVYFNKESFGDLDLLILNNGNINLLDIATSLGATETSKNGNVLSFDYKNFQIDLILVTPINWSSTRFFYSYSDLGNCIGKIVYGITRTDKKFSLKFSTSGLELEYYIEDQKQGKLTITKNPTDILNWLGISIAKYNQGFMNPTDLAETIYGTRLFDSNDFLSENIKGSTKKRDRKRPNLVTIIDTIKSKPHLVREQSSDQIINDLQLFFDLDLDSWTSELHDAFEVKKQVSTKFNGNLIIEKFGITGKILGEALGKFKKQHEDFDRYILDTSIEIILEDFKKFL